MRTWSNARGEGNLFSIDLLDEEGSEIKGTFFKAEANKWFDQLQEGQVSTHAVNVCRDVLCCAVLCYAVLCCPVLLPIVRGPFRSFCFPVDGSRLSVWRA